MTATDNDAHRTEDTFDRIARQVADEATWPPSGSGELAKLLFDGVLAYGVTSDESRVQPLGALYRHCLQNLTPDVRLSLYRELRDLVLNRQSSINTFMPFLFEESARSIVAEVVIDFCMTITPDADDPLSGCRSVFHWIDIAAVTNRGAMLGGLICLGDDRLAPLLDSVKWWLSSDEVMEAARCGTGMPTIAGLEFWLAWVEELVRNGLGESSLMGSVVAGLEQTERDRRVDKYHSIRRNFGYAARSASGEPEPSMHGLEALTPSQVAERYAERMYAVEAVEEPPKLMSSVLSAFGLAPRAPVEERYVPQ